MSNQKKSLVKNIEQLTEDKNKFKDTQSKLDQAQKELKQKTEKIKCLDKDILTGQTEKQKLEDLKTALELDIESYNKTLTDKVETESKLEAVKTSLDDLLSIKETFFSI